MKKKKHKALRITGIVIAIILGSLLLLLLAGFISGKLYLERDDDGKLWVVIDNTDGEKGTYEKVIDAMNTTYLTDLFVIGEDCHFPKDVPYTQVDVLTDDNITSEKTYKVIIVNDMNGTVALSDADYTFLYNKVIDGDYSFIYIGNAKLNKFVENGFITDSFQDGDRGFVVENYGGYGTKSIGFWTDDTQDMYDSGSENILSEALISGVIYDIIRGQ